MGSFLITFGVLWALRASVCTSPPLEGGAHARTHTRARGIRVFIIHVMPTIFLCNFDKPIKSSHYLYFTLLLSSKYLCRPPNCWLRGGEIRF